MLPPRRIATLARVPRGEIGTFQNCLLARSSTVKMFPGQQHPGRRCETRVFGFGQHFGDTRPSPPLEQRPNRPACPATRGQEKIPAVVIEAEEADCMVMSLVENIARRQHRPIDLMLEIGNLHQRGYTDVDIAEKIGCTQSWVNMIVTLLERGEERLVAAVETGLIPVSLAVDIARAKGDDVQALLMDAYEAGQIKGKKLGKIRRLLDQRLSQKKTVPDSGLGRRGGSRKLTQADLMRLYQREADKQRILVRKSDVTQARLIFIVEAQRDLLSQGEFPELLRDEGLSDMPRALADRLMPEPVR